jgi:hypothetical protein
MCAKIKIAGINELVSIPDKQAQEIKDGLKSFMIKPDEFIEVGSWSGKAREIKSLIMEKENNNEEIWQKSTEELKEIIVEFEIMIKEHTEGIPNSIQGKMKAIRDGKLPDCGWWRMMSDRGITSWYLENKWIFTENPKEGQKRKWMMTYKYLEDGVYQKEIAIDTLEERRHFAKGKNEEEFNHGL